MMFDGSSIIFVRGSGTTSSPDTAYHTGWIHWRRRGWLGYDEKCDLTQLIWRFPKGVPPNHPFISFISFISPNFGVASLMETPHIAIENGHL